MRTAFNTILLNSGFPFPSEYGRQFVTGLLTGAYLVSEYNPDSMMDHLLALHTKQASIEGYGG